MLCWCKGWVHTCENGQTIQIPIPLPHLTLRVPVRDLSMPVTMMAGSVAGVLYWVAIYPLDVVKSAMMTDSMVKADRKYPTILKTVQALWAEGGPKRFLRGLSPCLIRAVPANAAMLGTVSKVQVLLGL